MRTLEDFAPVQLDELDSTAGLRVRTDAKHVLDTAAFARLLDRLAPTHRALEIDGLRMFDYDTVYFDTEDLLTVRAHVQGRRRRFKCRSRLYADTARCAFELKRNGPRGITVKTRIDHPVGAHGMLTADAHAFLVAELGRALELRPTLRTTYRRITLLGPGTRLTADLDLDLGGARIRPGHVVVESKSEHGGAPADVALRALGSRPVALSKYLMGAGLTLLPQPPNDTRRIARRYFAHG